MLVLMYNVPQMESEREKRGGELAHLTSVNICIRKLPHMLRNRLCQHISWPTVRMRNSSNASPGLCFCFGFRHTVLWFLYVYTFVAVAPQRWLLSSFVFLFFGVSFAFPSLTFFVGLLFWLHLNQLVAVLCLHISTSFGFWNVHFLRCLRPFFCVFFGTLMKICKHFKLFPLPRLR